MFVFVADIIQCAGGQVISCFYYRVMHVVHDIAVVSRPSLCPSVTMMYVVVYVGVHSSEPQY